MPLFTSLPKSANELFQGDFIYKVPKNQREYSWTSDQINQFWVDIVEYTKNIGEYFIGPMVFVHKEKEDLYTIVDGQQRLATIAILIAVIRDIFHEIGDDGLKTRCDQKIRKQGLRPSDDTPRIELSQRNDQFFKKLVYGIDKPIVKIKDFRKIAIGGNKKLLLAYETFHYEITKIIKGKKKNQELIIFLDNILKSLNVINISVEDEEIAFQIFETLNERGARLTAADLVKNFVLARSGNLDTTYDSWENTFRFLGDANPSDFLRYYWWARKGYCEKKKLYHEIRNTIKTASDVEQMTNQLSVDSITYKALLNPKVRRNFWFNDDQIVDYLEELLILRADAPIPLLILGMEMANNKSEFKELVRLCTSFFFRTKTIEDEHAGPINELISKTICEKIRNKNKLDLNMIKKQLGKLCPSNGEFETKFSSAVIGDSRIATHVLRKINDYKRNQNSKGPTSELEVKKNVELEHILPQEPDTEWKKFMKKQNPPIIKDEIVDRIGNLTLLLPPYNKQASNHFFDKKVSQVYSISEIDITKDLSNNTEYHQWDISSINKRQNEFAKIASKIWAF